ncbi:cation diffusion facilitator 10 [Lindgomyces ingoldianus]|uniref:Cation diffusion facilitator 10 n=1 Tax=Lindgomyces ingoldianus TaxID=673940 RepID=A0ACB6R5W2_9PLEO|nr:cation diffusion facilitator 10 [Lindgomyces ingoldianus]KAF2474233.1 cation diffusion facilitator 10 [Lindgomyces ingoldianus]
MEDLSSSPAKSNLHRIPSLKAFLPLNAETTAISTRGQNLPALLHNQSSSSALTRRPSTIRSERRNSMTDDEDLEAGRPHGLMMPWGGKDRDDRRMSVGAQILNTPQMRSQRLIGNSNPRYQWERYFKSEEDLKQMKRSIRKYYERNNYLVQHYMYIDRLLDSSLPHNLIQEYSNSGQLNIPSTITEESGLSGTSPGVPSPGINSTNSDPPSTGTTQSSNGSQVKLKRTPKNLYKVPDEETPLLTIESDDPESPKRVMPEWEPDEEQDSNSPIVQLAIYVNMAANTALLIMKIIVAVLTSSLSVIASLVDAALDFLSTGIVWTTAYFISRTDQYAYPVGRRRLEPIGVLVFSIIMVTSFFQVAIEGFSRLTGDNHTIVQLTIPAIAIMAGTVVIKFVCWLWCRLIRNSSVQALAQDAMTDVVFNIFSIIFPLVGYYARIWWLDPLGGLLLSIFVITNWSSTSATHIRNLTGAACSADERNILLYLTMRFAKTIKQIQGIQAYHAGDKLNVEVDVVLDEGTSLRDSHDLGESLQYVLESVPYVDRAFVHLDYTGYNLPSHMQQQE